jgi:uncharacterized repeat protein (TIGR02543 family)
MKKNFTRIKLILLLFSFFYLKSYSQTKLPDYIITDATVAPTTIISGVTQVYTYCKIKNAGDGNGYSGDTELRLYVNQDYTSTAGTGFGMTYYSNPLAPGFSSDEININNTINLAAGDYYMVFKVAMPESDDEESDATNNISYLPITILANMAVETDGNGTVSGVKTSGYSKDETVSLAAVPNEGYEFLNWSENGKVISTDPALSFKASESRNLKAYFTKKKFTVTVTSNPIAGGQNNSSTIYDYGTTATLEASPNTDYYLVNWTVNGGEVSTSSKYSFDVKEDVNIVANYRKAYTINLSTSGLGNGTVTGGGLYNENTSVIIKATPADNSRFDGWYKNSTLYSKEKEVTFTATEDLSLTAKFSYITHSIMVSVNNSNYGTIKIGSEYISGSSDGASFVHNSTCQLTAEPYNEEYTFKNWTENGTEVSTDNPYSFQVTADRDIVANFSVKKYTLTLQTTDGGTVTGQGTYNYNTTATIKATPNTGYSFVNWTNNGVKYSTNATESILMTVDRTYKANFAKSFYTVTLTASTGGSTSGSGSYEYGSSCTVTATPSTGYAFLNWTESGTVVSTSASYTFTLGAAAKTLKANFVKTYTITLQAGTGGYTSGQGTFNTGTSCTVTATPYNGYTFVNWTEGSSSVSKSASYNFTISAARTLKANFAVQTFSIALETTTGGTVSGQGTYDYGTNVTVTATPNTGCSFTGWTENGTLVTSSASYTFTAYAARTLKANFSVPTFSIALETTTGGTASGQETYNYGTSVTVTATPNTGFNFVSWTENGTIVSTSASYTFTATAARSLKANFAINTYTIALAATTGGSASGQGTYNYGTSITVTATPNTGYSFVSWTENGTVVSTSAFYTFTATAARSLKANFSSSSYTIALEATTGGSVSGQGTYGYGTSVTVTATPNTGYSFVNWTENGTPVSSSASYTFTAAAGRSLNANFMINTYTIELEATTGGSVSGQGNYDYGTSVTVTATPNTNYSFVSWTENGTFVSSSASYTFTATAARSLEANFSINTYTIALEATTGGSVSGQGTYGYGTSVTVTATPSTGYNFVSWTENGIDISTDASYSFTIDNNRTLKANFVIQTFSITLETTDGGSVTGAGSYEWGKDVIITATPNAGYNFQNWTENGTVVTTDAVWTFQAYSARRLSANFQLISGISNLKSTNECTLYPVPAADHIFITFEELEGVTLNEICIALYDMSGKRYDIDKMSINGNTVQCSLPDIMDGVYYLNLTIEKSKTRIMKKVVIVN